MADLSKTGITSGYSITPTHITNLYDCLTGTTAFDNIQIAKFEYLNAGGTAGSTGYGLRNNSGTIEFKNNGGAWAGIATGGGGSTLTVAGSNNHIQINDGSSGLDSSTSFTYDDSGKIFRCGDLAGSGNNTYISMSDSQGNIACQSTGLFWGGDYPGFSLGTYVSIDDVNEVIRIQCEGSTFIGDDDWVGYGNGTHIEVNDVNQQVSMSATNGVVISNLSTGVTIDVGSDATGKLQLHVSDFRLKENIEPIENALDKVLNLNGVNFEWIDKDNRGHGKQIGMIAQDVEKQVPEVVFEDDDYYGMNYSPLVAVLVEAIKEQQPQIDELMKRLDKLENNG